MTDNHPLVSVCIPAYNAAGYIEQTLSAVIGQSYSNIEIIVVNDGSVDGTLEAITAMADTRIKVYNTENAGAAAARNTAYARCNGEYIIFFDADDLIATDFVSSQMQAMAGRKNVVVLSAWGRFYDDSEDVIAEPLPAAEMTLEEWINLYWYQATPMTNPGRALLPRKLIEEAGGWNERISLNDDLEFFTRIFLKADRIIFNGSAILKYRSGVRGISGVKTRVAYQSLCTSIALSITSVLNRYSSLAVKQSCANMWQSFIYEVYPSHPDLIALAKAQLKQLPPPDLKFPAGGITRQVAALLGWKPAKRIKQIIGR